MAKHNDLLKRLGFTEDQVKDLEKDDVDIENMATSFLDTQRKLIEGDGAFIEPIKKSAKDKGLAEAFLKSKKDFNKVYQLGLTNKELEDTEVEDLFTKAKEKIAKTTAGDPEEVKKLTDQLFETSQKLVAKEEEIIEREKAAMQKADERVSTVITQLQHTKHIAGKKYILPIEEAQEHFMLKAQKNGITFKVDDKGTIIPQKDGYPLKKADNTGFETLESLSDGYLKHFEQKSNGSGGAGNGGSAGDGGGEDPKILVPGQAQRYLDNHKVAAPAAAE